MFTEIEDMSFDLSSRNGIRDAAGQLISHLASERLESNGHEWTGHNFTRLRGFFRDRADVEFFHKPRIGVSEETGEFMWDFLAVQSQGGILLAAESEQDHGRSRRSSRALLHDFSKLLYVFAPIRLFISKAKTIEEATRLQALFSDYAKGCCLHFNPGSAFVLHFDLSYTGSVSYVWQSKGKPSALNAEEINFGAPMVSK